MDYRPDFKKANGVADGSANDNAGEFASEAGFLAEEAANKDETLEELQVVSF